ncbi:MAG: GNAT family N-acetyltransferase [Bacteroidetes bacterium]|nr:GNAT family N-acetyltransferase [Bacteroidota bacterium]
MAVNREVGKVRGEISRAPKKTVKKQIHSAGAMGAVSRGSLGLSIPEYSLVPLDLSGLRQLLQGPLRVLLPPLLRRQPRLLYVGRLHYPDVMSLAPDAAAMPLLGDFMREEGIRFALAPDRLLLPGWVTFRTEPVMLLHINAQWQQFPDYLSALNSKHRVKARRILAIAEPLRYRELDAAGLHDNRAMLDTLFAGLKQRIPFMLGALNARFFEEQIAHYGNRLHLRLYELEGKPVGFISLLEEEGTVYALHACSDPAENKRLHIYQRMLYDAVELAISRRCELLHLGRTAAGIKSSIGAEAIPGFYSVYARGALMRLVLRILARWARPDQEPIRKAFR